MKNIARAFSSQLAVLGLSTAAIYLTQLGNPLGGGHSDETLYIGIAADMMRHREWLVPIYHGQPALYKPPLLYWLMILSFKMFGGQSLFAARFPAAICGVGLALTAALIGKELFEEKTGILAGWMTATAIPGVYAFARAGLMDIPLTLCLAASFYFACMACKTKTAAPLAASFALMALSTLFKGPVSFLLWLFPALWLLYSTRGWTLLKTKRAAIGVTAAAAVALAWPAALFMNGYGKSWVEFFIVRENLGKFASRIDHTTRAVPGSVIWIHLFSQLLPWTFFFIAALAFFAFNKEGRKNPRGFLLAWILTVVFVFLLPAKKLSHYTLPALPATALLAADAALNPASAAFSIIAADVTGIIFALAGVFLLMLTRITGNIQDAITVFAAGAAFAASGIFLFRKNATAAAICAAGFLFFYALGLPHIMSPLSLPQFESTTAGQNVYAYDFDAGILSRAARVEISPLEAPLAPRAGARQAREHKRLLVTQSPYAAPSSVKNLHGAVVILPEDDRIDFIKAGYRLSPPLLDWTQWKDHIRILDILQAILSGQKSLIHEEIIAVKID